MLDATKTIKVIRGSRAREEVSGHLMADFLGVEVLPGKEAIRLGETVRRAAIAWKEGDTQCKNGASAKKSRLRQNKAMKDSELAACLDAELQQIDSETETARAQLLHEPVDLAGLPDPNSKIVESRAPQPVLLPATTAPTATSRQPVLLPATPAPTAASRQPETVPSPAAECELPPGAVAASPELKHELKHSQCAGRAIAAAYHMELHIPEARAFRNELMGRGYVVCPSNSKTDCEEEIRGRGREGSGRIRSLLAYPV